MKHILDELENLRQLRQELVAAQRSFQEEFFEPRWLEIDIKDAIRSMARATAENIANIVGMGIGQKVKNGRPTGQLSIRIYVIQKVPKQNEDEVPTDLLIPKKHRQFQTDVVAVGRPVLRQSNFFIRPVHGGVSIGNSNEASAGTMGCLVRSQNDDAILLLSNNHVLARENHAAIGEEIVQPGIIDNGTDVVARLENFCRIHTDGVTPNLVDAAVARPIDPNLVSDEILGIGRPRGIVEPVRDRWVVKCGRTTDLTRGYIDDVNVTIQIEFEDGIARFTDQILIWGVPAKEYYELPTAIGMSPTFSDAGDSGSAILDERTKCVVGLLFAGSDEYNVTFANKISNVVQELGVRIP